MSAVVARPDRGAHGVEGGNTVSMEQVSDRIAKLEKDNFRLRSVLKRLLVLQDRETTGQSNLVKDWQNTWDEVARLID